MESSKHPGTQTIARAMLLLRELAAHGQFGWSLGDLAAHCDIDKGTAHRLLAQLKRERMVQQRASDRRYIPGPLLYELGFAMVEYDAFLKASRSSLERVSKRLGAVAFLFLRSGYDFVCAARVDGVRAKALSLGVGVRRPLITSAGGIAMLIAMPQEESRPIIAHNLTSVSRFSGHSVASLKRMLAQSQLRNLAVNEETHIPGWNAYALAVRDATRQPFASIMVAAEADRLSLTANPNMVKVLTVEADTLGHEAARLLPAVM